MIWNKNLVWTWLTWRHVVLKGGLWRYWGVIHQIVTKSCLHTYINWIQCIQILYKDAQIIQKCVHVSMYLLISLYPFIIKFNYCKPILIVDEIHLKGSYQMNFISARTLDKTCKDVFWINKILENNYIKLKCLHNVAHTSFCCWKFNDLLI